LEGEGERETERERGREREREGYEGTVWVHGFHNLPFVKEIKIKSYPFS
jgi:hypothetical protein